MTIPCMLTYIKRCQKSWARITEARNLLESKDRRISKVLGLLDDAIRLLEENIELDDENLDLDVEDEQFSYTED